MEAFGVQSTKILIGTSGFSYKDWKGPFYPEKFKNSEMLSYYASHFPAVKINSTYYAFPRIQSIEAMVKKTGGKVEFTVKAHKDFAHNRELAEKALPYFKQVIRSFQESNLLGCVLLQFPFSFKNNLADRDFLVFLKNEMVDVPLVAEFRNRDWIVDETFEFLKQNDIGFCCVDEPRIPIIPPPVAVATSDIGYIRFHRRNAKKWFHHVRADERYDYEYTENELREWVVKIEGIRPPGQKTLYLL